MKFYVGSKSIGIYLKNEISKKFKKDGGFISLAAVKEMLRETPNEDDNQYGWDTDSGITKKMRVRECKDGQYLYLPEPNAKICFNKNDTKFEEDSYKQKNYDFPLPDIDVCVFETVIFEKLVKAIDDGFTKLLEGEQRTTDQTLEYLYNSIIPSFFFCTRPCVVKAKKSGRKEERQDRPAKFHRWADLSKGVQQVVAIVEFDDGHVEQVQPDRVIFKEVE